MSLFKELMKSIEDGNYKPIYFLMGDETFFIDKISDYIEKNVLKEEEKAFNQVIFYGNEINIYDVITQSRRYPLMSKYQVIIVKEAQHIKNIDELAIYVENPQISTILVVNYKYNKLDKRKKLYQLLNKKGYLFEFNKLYENQVPEWINEYLTERGYSIDMQSAILLTDFIGNDLSKIANELEKLMIAIGNDKKITTSHIEKFIGISREYNNFELIGAIANKDIGKATKIALYFGKNPKNNPFILTLISLFSFFSKVLLYHSLKDKSKNVIANELKINPYFIDQYVKAAKNYSPVKIKKIISLIREYDLKSKGINNISADDGDLLKEMLYKIMN